MNCCCSVAPSCPTPRGPPGRQHARLPCPPPSPGVCSDSVIEFLADSVYLFLLFKAPPPHPPTTSFPFKEKRVWLTGSSPVGDE